MGLFFVGICASTTACTDGVLEVTGCAGEDCVPCEDHGECTGETFCGDDGFCQEQICAPGEAICEGGGVIRCDAEGSGFHPSQGCASGICQDGVCRCSTISDCGPGQECEGGLCTCPTGISCGPEGLCCGEGESCASLSICADGDGCENVFVCRPACEGDFCGLSGELCCEGSTPVCGPIGQCAPDCGAAELCGIDFDECCPSGDLCVFGTCRTPGEPCNSFIDCDWGEYCDQALGVCMPDDFPQDIECRLEGDFLELEVVEKWAWEDNDIISIPVVGDVTGDGQPNVVVNVARANQGQPDYDPDLDFYIGEIVILDSAGQEVRRILHNPGANTWGSQGRSNIALADVSGDGILDILYASRPIDGTNFGLGRSYIVAANGAGQTLWRARDGEGNLVTTTVYNGAVTVANLNGDSSRAEVVVGAMIIDSGGTVVWQDGDGATEGSNDGYTGGIAVVADLTGDGRHEIVTGRRAFTVDWQADQVNVQQLWAHDGPDGYPAVADMNGNGHPEVVLVAARTVRILEGTTGRLVCGVDPTDLACQGNDGLRTQPVYLPGPSTQNRGGPPTIADFDGDGRPEIGVAGGHYYTVFDFRRPFFGDDPAPEQVDQALLAQFGQPQPDNGELYVRWFYESQDLSSNTTGSSVFDFQGDGRASVVYADECYLRVFNGVDGAIELEIMNSTGTILEYPLVVDVDANGRSEILVVANDVDYGCSAEEGFEFRKGLFVYEDPNDRWVRTRSIWNQHAYSIDNILDDGSVPHTQAPSWESHNTFRANRQGEIPLNAADVAITGVQANPHACPLEMDFLITIQNQGVASIPAGLPVTVYRTEPTAALLTTLTVPGPITPGGTAVLSYSYEVPTGLFNLDLYFLFRANDDGSEETLVFDCNPDSASWEAGPLVCRYAL
jgi:hypothetical protein